MQRVVAPTLNLVGVSLYHAPEGNLLMSKLEGIAFPTGSEFAISDDSETISAHCWHTATSF